MNRPSHSKTPAAGGFPIAIGLTVGAVLGMTRGNALLWLLAGGLVGVGIAVVIWLVDRKN
ncbi:hypothetical protein FPZ24_02940 [Sphingomonas panacisoli]|uniref:Uncharacterized protein n=1 Tax=Sphingomonas panacisoli TaxID=1813879 RepID=A0A5B8LF44_9SPHN|nr:hypothetical protein [Sphingomonas panacisoli]QDZ06556.1 hypothetical protein FPZ24_02940 [Sphingomonas panacisoli]